MKYCLFFLLSFTLLPFILAAPKQYSIQEFLETISYEGASFSPDKKKILLSSDISGIFNAYSLQIADKKMQALTDSQESVHALTYFPQDERILYSSDQGGNERNHIYVRELDGAVKDLTPKEGLKAHFFGWAHDEKSFFVISNERDPRFFDIYEYKTKNYERTLFFQNDQGHTLQGISRDKKYLALGKVHTNDSSDIYLHELKTGKTTQINPQEKNDVVYRVATFAPDGKSLYYITDKDFEFTYLKRFDIGTGKSELIYQSNWGVQYAHFSRRGTYLIIQMNNDARSELIILDQKDKRPLSLPEIPNASIHSLSISNDESMICFYATNGEMPSDLFVYNLKQRKISKLTSSLSSTMKSDDLVSGEVVRFSSYDGLEVPGILYKPHQASPENKCPALVWVHGGPGGQSRIGYSALIQYLTNHGYVIYAINNRGSSGYGKTFYQLDDRKHGDADLKDCLASKKMLIDTGYVNKDQIGIIGGSYGGYMVLAALAFTPEEFEVGVDIFGVANWVRTLNSIPTWWEAFRKALEKELGEFDDTEYLTKISPLFHAEKIRKPLMVLQGANDPRVLQIESDEIVAAVKKNKVPVEYIVFADEGHGFRKKKNREEGYEAILLFLDKYLRK